MNKRVIGIVVSTLLLLGLIAVAWLWYLGRSTESGTPTASSSATSKVPTSVTGAGNGYSTNVSAGGETNPSTAGQATLAGRITGGRYNTSTGTYTLSGGTYNSSAGTYTTTNGYAVSGGTYNPSNNTYTVGGGTYNVSDGSYTTGSETVVTTLTSSGGTNATSTSSGNSASNSGGTTNETNGTGGTTTQTLTGTSTAFTPTPVNSGVTWAPDLGGAFTGTSINQINDTNPQGPGTIFNPTVSVSTNSGGLNGTDAAIAALGIGAAYCTGMLAISAGVTTAAATAASGAATAAITVMIPVTNPTLSAATGAAAGTLASDAKRDDFLNCITRNIAKAVLAQMTRSIVNWINGGFQGSPAFLQNRQAFFANVANQTAGQFIAGSGLAFLCSPFQLQVRIALAQAYASRNTAPSCTLTQVINNVNGFFNGNFSAGGWPGILSITTMPQNNAFGAFAAGQVQLDNRLANAAAQNGSLISVTGFISQVPSFQQLSCSGDARTFMNAGNTYTTSSGTTYRVASSVNGKVPCPDGCNCNITTPGQVISDSLASNNKATFDSLNMAKNFDEIINALLTQLVTKTLQEGLSNLSNNGGYGSEFMDPSQNQAATLGSQLLSQMQQSTSLAQQYGGVQQGMITDLQGAQSQLSTLKNCWGSAASSTVFSAAQQATAQTNAGAASAQINALQGQVDAANSEITHANDIIARIEQFESGVLNATSLQDVQDVQNLYDSATLITTTDVSNASADRATLQSQLNLLNSQTSTGLSQCYAFGATH